VVHAGRPLDADTVATAEREMRENPRYLWLGEVSHEAALDVLARSRLLVVTSRSEGGANVVSEALAAGIPVLSTRIDGSTGVLGDDYPGLFPVGDVGALVELLQRVETDDEFRHRLRAWCARSAELVRPGLERDSWRNLLGELFPKWVGDRG
jgi:glycosyltransferase involved in cell wall biosynthesis